MRGRIIHVDWRSTWSNELRAKKLYVKGNKLGTDVLRGSNPELQADFIWFLLTAMG